MTTASWPRRGRARCALPLAAALALAGCPSPPGPPSQDEVLEKMRREAERSGTNEGKGGVTCVPPPLEIFLQADPTLNLNAQGQPMPVEVRALLLREREHIDQLDFESVWRDNGAALGKDLVSSASLTVFPGKLKIYPTKSAPGVAFVALVGIFRRPEGRSWKYVVDIKEHNKRCAVGDDLHTIIHAALRGSSITNPE